MEARQAAQKHRMRASAALEIGRYQLAEKEARVALSLDPRDPESSLCLARALLGQGRHADAEGVAESAIALNPRDAYGHYVLGFVRQSQGAHARAIAPLREAVAIDPRASCYQSRLAIALAETGDREGARVCLAASLERAGDDAGLHAEAARVCVLLDELARAEELARRAVVLSPDSAHPHGLLAWVLGRARKYEEACGAARAALRIEPNNVGAWADLGFAEYNLGRLGDAERALREALRLRPGLPSAAFNLASVLLRKGRLREAERVCDEGLTKDPGSASLQRLRADVRFARKERTASLVTARGALLAMMVVLLRMVPLLRGFVGPVIWAALFAATVLGLYWTFKRGDDPDDGAAGADGEVTKREERGE